MAVDPPALEGRLVEIHGLEGPAEVRDRRLNLVGEAVDANGARGLASWDAGSDEYAVATPDGLVLRVPGANLRECDSLGPEEEDGCDLVWPTLGMARVGATFGAQVAELLQAKGYCQIRMPQDGAMRQAMLEFAATDWGAYTVPRHVCEEAYLGHGASSKVMWLSDAELPREFADGPMRHYNQHLMDVSYGLFPLTSEFLGFEPSEYRDKTLLRVPLAGEAERQRLEEAPFDESDIDSGLLEAHLDFVQRRRLCMMYLLGGEGGSLHLQPRESPEEAVALPVAGGRLVLFRHDALSYSYAPGGARDLALQSWLMERPSVLRLDGFDGDLQSVEAIFGGPAQSPDQQVHVMAGMCRFPGSAYGLAGDWAVYSSQTDAFREVPSYRWDFNLYYAETDAQFGGGEGKSCSKHCGFLHDEELISFDNEFFGIDSRVAKLIAPIQRVCLEVTFEMLVLAGFNRTSLQGAPIMCCVADCGLEWGMFEGMNEDPQAWLRAADTSVATTSNRLCYILGLTGPSMSMDTACSATMVGAQICHGTLRKHTHKAVDKAFFTGVNLITNPFAFIGLTAAGMLGRGGRCKTFDDSANGFNRGEGTGGAFLKVQDDAQSALDRLGSFVSSYVNQDGRSASLTAPNGPSQQACIRGSWRQAGLAQKDVVTTENHGTGTALGDPIECGTVRSVFRGHVGLPVTSGKTHMGHLESTAGSIGFLKIILSLNHAAVPGNCHLRRLNAHIEFDSHFAGFCTTELCDLPDEHHHGGANSYGFGGTNARADLWARRLHRVRDTDKQPLLGEAPMMRLAADRVDFMAVTCAQCGGPMCWLCGAATPEVGRRVGRHRCADVRAAESAPACCDRCYDGDYLHRHGAPGASASSSSMDRGARIHLAGTWNAWMEPTEMARVSGLDDVYEGEVVLSDIRFELFHIVVRHVDGSEMVIHPAAKRAGPRIRVAGPHKQGQGRHWLIDGIRDGAPAGTVYRVRFEWGDFWKSVTWEALADRPLVPEEDRFRHMYCIASSLTGWAPLRGGHACVDYPNPCDVDDTRSWHWSRGTLPASGTVELLFLRDYDQTQMIYPMQRHPTDESVPVAGPDEFGTGKRWLAYGTEGERLYTTIAVEEGVITVRISTATMGDLVWRSPCRSACLAYYAVGSWNSWACTEMESDEGSPDIYRCRFVMGRAGWERFKVVANQNWGMQLYPSQSDGYPGTCLVSGPDGRGHNSNWLVEGTPGQRMEVVLDLDAEDNRSMVTCVCVDDVD